jgi:hypothetical protein
MDSMEVEAMRIRILASAIMAGLPVGFAVTLIQMSSLRSSRTTTKA